MVLEHLSCRIASAITCLQNNKLKWLMANWGHAACMSPEIDSCSSQWNIDVSGNKKPGDCAGLFKFRIWIRAAGANDERFDPGVLP
jgi:hypothetical protein